MIWIYTTYGLGFYEERPRIDVLKKSFRHLLVVNGVPLVHFKNCDTKAKRQLASTFIDVAKRRIENAPEGSFVDLGALLASMAMTVGEGNG